VLIRGVGPTLAQFEVASFLPATALSLFAPGGATLADNSGWGGGAALAAAFTQVGAFPLPAGSDDSAILNSLNAGSSYTAQVSGTSGSTGVALIEVYDADTASAPTARLVNISARAQVGAGPNMLAAGFVVSGFWAETLLIRAVGPTLGQFGVTGVLTAPQLQVFDATGNVVASGAAWVGTTALSAAFAQAGAFALPAGSADCALLVLLPPGAYSAQVSGIGGATGVALIEVYDTQ